MGSVGPGPTPPLPPPPPLTALSDAEDEIVVVVTGFRPFRAEYPINPSWSIVESLPPFIPLSSAPSSHLSPTPLPQPPPSHLPPAITSTTTTSTSTSTTTTTTALPPPTSHPPQRIRLLAYPAPIRVSYATVRALVPTLWARHAQIDFMIHVGMAGGRDFYSVERRGHRDGYQLTDVDGVVLGDESDGRYDLGEGGEEDVDLDAKGREKWVWEGCPEVLETDVDIDDVWRRWKRALPDIDVRPSEDAGRYLCDFIYYSSLAELWKRDEERRVVFFHVPVESDDAAIARGREVLVELIKALVQSRKTERVVQPLRGKQALVT